MKICKIRTMTIKSIVHAAPLVFALASSALAADDKVDAAMDAATRPIIGAIRWDAWHTPWSKVKPDAGDGPVAAMMASLSPQQYHYRAPFFARVTGENELRIDGYTPAIMDQEIAFAKAGKLDYWAFLLYDESSPMSQGLSLYLSNAHRRDVGFCAIAQGNTFGFGNAQSFEKGVARVVKLMAEPGYVRVLQGRPLLYLFDVTDKQLNAWGGAESAKKRFDGLRDAAKAAHVGDPYIVILDFKREHGKQIMEAVGAQAISSYVTQGGGKAASYADLARSAHGFWDRCAATGAPVVPIAVAGWDRRPRIEHPVPWESWQKPGVGMDAYYQMPSPQELAAHIRDAMEWTLQKGAQSPARAVLIYAWNEHDEGGFLCPTLNPDGSANTQRLDAIAAMKSAP